MVSPAVPRLRDYWAELLAGSAGAELPADWRRDPGSERRLADERAALPADALPPAAQGVAGAGADLLASERATGDGLAGGRFATVLAAWYAVLHRHTGQADLLVGSRFRDAGGAIPGARPGAGIVIPLRTVVNPDKPFPELVQNSCATVSRAFRQIRDGAAPDPAVMPRMAVGITLAAMIPEPDASLAGAQTPFDAELIIGPGGTVRLAYDASVFSRSSAVRLLRHLARLLAAARTSPGAAVRRLPVEDEPAPPPPWPLAAAADPGPDLPDGLSLAGAFARVAARYPDRVAVTGRSGSYRYADLDRASAAQAARIAAAAGPGRRVGLLCDHDTGVALGIWSALRAGAAYVPLDPRQPDGRLARIIADARIDAIACDAGLTRRARALARRRPVLPLTAPEPAAGPEPAGSPALPPADPGALAYLLHTSGTTGGPKAVMQTNAGVLGHARAYARRLGTGPADRVPLLARFTFDLAVVDFFATLLTGGSLHVIDPLAPAPDLWRAIGAAGATIVHCTPTHYRHLLSGLGGPAGTGPAVPASVRAVVLGGERVTRDDVQGFLAHFPERAVLVSGLSATECSVALQHLSRRSDLSAAVLPVGGPVDGVAVRLLDDAGLPTEVYGELEFTSERVALGYWDRPDATAAVFGTHPDGTRFYRTGDLAYRRPDGALVHRGRRDRQVKIRGHRVEPSEIEALLRLHPTVAQAAVRADEGPAGTRLAAYATSATTVPLDPAELAGYLGRQLPDYAVPHRIVALDAMPVGPTGKLDYARLPPAGADVPGPGDEPRAGLESEVAAIWRDVLGVSRVSARSTFMASGGDSVRLMVLLGRLRDDLGADLPLIDVLRNPTVAGIAGLIECGAARGRPPQEGSPGDPDSDRE